MTVECCGRLETRDDAVPVMARTWRVAESILQLIDEVNAAAPGRNKASDGTIGDAAHQSRDSDHNPWVTDRNGVGVVTAVDLTHDPAGGADMRMLAGRLVKRARNGDRRIKYIIWNRRIFNLSIRDGWRDYTGSNPHTKHLHLSVASTQSLYDSDASWGITATVEEADPDVLTPTSPPQFIADFQRRLRWAINTVWPGDTIKVLVGANLTSDGFQGGTWEQRKTIDADGDFGSITWSAWVALADVLRVNTPGVRAGRGKVKVPVEAQLAIIDSHFLYDWQAAADRFSALWDANKRQHERIHALEQAHPGGVHPDPDGGFLTDYELRDVTVLARKDA